MAVANGAIRNPTLKIATLGAALFWVAAYFVVVWPNGQPLTGRVDSIWKAAVLHLPALDSLSISHRPKPPIGPSAASIEDAFAGAEYSLGTVADGTFDVPQVHLSAIPSDMVGIADTDGRKSLFLRMVLPLVLSVNESILTDRVRIEAIQNYVANNRPVSRADGEWLRGIAREYKISPSAGLAKLLRRVDVVPPSLALAQAAVESGWGTSRFARQGNALFGQWGAPDDRQGKTHAAHKIESEYNVRTFATPGDAVKSYIHNLNTHGAYADFRGLRAWERRRGMELNGASLVHALENYSELAVVYVKSLRTIMRSNKLGALDDAHLSEDPISLAF